MNPTFPSVLSLVKIYYLHFVLLALLASSLGCSTAGHRGDHWFGRDKLSHFAVTSVIAAATTKIAENNGATDCQAPVIGFSVAMTVGFSKELYDKYFKKTYFSWKDMTWNFIGSGLGTLAASNCR